MRHGRVSAVAAAAIALASSVFMSDPAVAAPSAQSNSPKDTAQQIIHAARADDLFEVEDGAGTPSARHLRSGLICIFFPGGQTDGIQIGSQEGLPRGDDVSCFTNDHNLNLYIFGSHYDPSVTVDNQMARLTADLSKSLEQGKVQANHAYPGEHPMRAASVSGAMGGKALNAFAIVGQVKGWTFSIVCMAPPAADETCRKILADLAETELRSMVAAAGTRP